MTNAASAACFDVGRTYYTREGRKVELLAITTDGQYVVGELYEVDTYDGATTVNGPPCFSVELFKTAPRAVVDQELTDLRAEADRLRDQNHQARMALLNDERDARARIEKLKAYRGLERIEDFIEGRITHVVLSEYDSYKIVPLAELQQKTDYGRDEGLRLISLLGKSNGDLQWMVNHWRDGSGGYRPIVPCASEDEAVLKRSALIASHVELNRPYAREGSNPWLLERAIDFAIKYSVPVPDDLMEWHRRYSLKNLSEARQALEKSIAEAASKVADIERTVADLQAASAPAEAGQP